MSETIFTNKNCHSICNFNGTGSQQHAWCVNVRSWLRIFGPSRLKIFNHNLKKKNVYLVLLYYLRTESVLSIRTNLVIRPLQIPSTRRHYTLRRLRLRTSSSSVDRPLEGELVTRTAGESEVSRYTEERKENDDIYFKYAHPV